MTKSSDSSGSWPETVKAIGLRAASRGQLVPFMLLLVLFVIAYRMDSDTVKAVVTLFFSSKLYAVLGWILFALVTAVSILVIRSQRRLYTREIQRIVDERNRLQNLINGGIASSQPQPAIGPSKAKIK